MKSILLAKRGTISSISCDFLFSRSDFYFSRNTYTRIATSNFIPLDPVVSGVEEVSFAAVV